MKIVEQTEGEIKCFAWVYLQGTINANNYGLIQILTHHDHESIQNRGNPGVLLQGIEVGPDGDPARPEEAREGREERLKGPRKALALAAQHNVPHSGEGIAI